MDSDISGFYRMSLDDRLQIIQESGNLDEHEITLLKTSGALDVHTADMMIENVIGTTQIPLGVATYFRIDGRDTLVPMAIEEPSVVAAASHAAKLARPGGFVTESDDPIMIGQIQMVGIGDAAAAGKKVQESMENLKKACNRRDSTLIKLGGGMKGLETRVLKTSRGDMLIVHLLIDVRDAMGANVVNTMCETAAPMLEKITGGAARMKIVSNLANKRVVRARAVWKKDDLGEDLIEAILDAYEFARSDVYRCATHNKGTMNGIDSVLMATGNDWRAVESGAHAYAAASGYKPLTHYELDSDGNLAGSIELPMALGTVGGATKTHPIAKIALKITRARTASELGRIAACVGLANNFAAMRAIVKEGIQHGHMKLHANNIAILAGARKREADKIAKRMIKEKNVSVSRAKEILEESRG